jgi:hypothetical protein
MTRLKFSSSEPKPIAARWKLAISAFVTRPEGRCPYEGFFIFLSGFNIFDLEVEERGSGSFLVYVHPKYR